MQDLLTVLASVTFSGLLTTALIWVLRTWISERLRQSIQHEYAQKLEAFKAKLQAEHNVALEKLRADHALRQATQASVNATFAASHLAGHDRRLGAVETLWKELRRLRDSAPLAVSFTDWFRAPEYEEVLKQPRNRCLVDQLSEDSIAQWARSNDAEIVRPFVGEYLYALFFAYRAFIGRIAVLLMTGLRFGEFKEWADDDGIKQLLTSLMTPDERHEFERLKLGRFTWILALVEQKMLTHMERVISGTDSADISLAEARRIREAASHLEQQSGADTPN
jgi:hypothetical protein